jgi:ribosomal-protein-alanine N-acetyltransferase
MDIRLAHMKNIHLDQVVVIENNSFPTPWSQSAFAQELTNNDFAYYIVALMENQVAGYAGMWIILDEGHITTIAVHPAHRHQGIGAFLLNSLLKEAKKRACDKMTLEVRPSNRQAIDLYEKAGFVSYGVRPGYYSDTQEDAVIMWMDI